MNRLIAKKMESFYHGAEKRFSTGTAWFFLTSDRQHPVKKGKPG
jgi:hypothetical protein